MNFLFFFTVFLLTFFSFSLAFNVNRRTVLYIDCGGDESFKDSTSPSKEWISDRFFSGGVPAFLSTPNFGAKQLTTIRHFSLSDGKKNCYMLPISAGRFRIGLSFIYSNYDLLKHPPLFEVSLGGTVVLKPQFWPQINDSITISDYFRREYIVELHFEQLYDICFLNSVGDDPVISSIDLDEIHPLTYGLGHVKRSLPMSHPWYTLERLTFDLEIQELDVYGRKWFLGQGSVVISTDQFIDGADISPNEFPMALYQSAIVGTGGGLKFSTLLTSYHGVDVDIKHVYLWLHFAEIDPSIAGSGWRVFDIYVNGDHLYEVDISRAVDKFTAYFLQFFFSVTSPVLEVELRSQKGLPLICGMEIFLHIPGDSMVTNEEQANAMIAVRDDLILPRIMGWNGYPCAPSEWDTWEGIACTVSNNEMVIAEISLASRMIAGQLSAKVGDLESLTVLNLSHNMLNGRIPKELGKLKSLKVLDFSFNNFSGPVPKDILNLNISVNFLGNKYLCGPPFPPCRDENEARLSIGSKIGIIIASALFIGLFILALRQAFTDGCIINWWKGRNATGAAVEMVAIRND